MKEDQGREGGGYMKEVEDCPDSTSSSSSSPLSPPSKVFSHYYHSYIFSASKLHLASFPSYRACSKVSYLLFYLPLHLIPLSFQDHSSSFPFEKISKLKHTLLPSCLPLQPTASLRFPHCPSPCPANHRTTLLRPGRRLIAASLCLLPRPAQV